MEMYTYKCNQCNFVHCVPAYWTSYKPDLEVDMPHLNLETKETCINTSLILEKE